MAMKPAGKAIMVALVAGIVGGGVYFSGVLNKLPKQEAAAPAEQQVAVPQPTVVTNTAPVVAESPQPAVNAAAESNDAFDALISKGTKK